MNIGANSITDTGLYFQWGDTQGYTADQVGNGEGLKYFDWIDYKYCNGTSSVMTKYTGTDDKTVLDAEDDTVTAAWEGNWRMPTISEFIALREAVTTDWTDDYQGSGVAGLVCTDKTDPSKVLFFPAVGYCEYGSVYEIGISGYYLSSSLSPDSGCNSAYYFNFNSVGVDYNTNYPRSGGFPVRGVLAEN